jgi:hypothetical protein
VDFGGKPYQSRPQGGYWLAKEFHTWPEVEEAGLAAIGIFVELGIWAASVAGSGRLLRNVWRPTADADSRRRLVDCGLWVQEGEDYRTKSMAELRSGRGRPGLTMRLDRRVYLAPQCARPKALGLWAVAASWSLNTDTPGFIPTQVALSLAKPKVISELWDCGYWLLSEDGFRMSKGDTLYARWALARDDERADIPETLRARVYARDGHRCLLCGAGYDLTLDHIVPWSWGGTDTEDNLRTLCRPCNSSKGDRLS